MLIFFKLFSVGCKDETSARLSYNNFVKVLDAFIANTSDFGCPLPCQQSVYNTKLRYFHRNDIENIAGMDKEG